MPDHARRRSRHTAAAVAAVAAVALAAAVAGSGLLPPAPAVGAVLAPYAQSGAEPIAPGAMHEWGSVVTQYGDQRVNVVTAEPWRSELSFRAAISNDRAGGLERTSVAARRMSADGSRVVAAINADVWSSTGSLMGQAPNGIHIQDGELASGDTLSRALFGVGPDRTPRIGQVRLGLTLTTASGAAFKVRRINQRPDGGLSLFTARFGSRLSTALTGREVVIGGLDLPLRPGGTWTGTVRTVRDAGGGARIDPATIVLVAPRSSFALYDLVRGARVTLRIEITPGWETVTQAVSGRGFLVRDGVPAVSPRPADGRWTHPRSALGIGWDGRVIFLTVDGRGNGSRGVDLDDLAALLVSRGAAQAINLDGGSSSSLAVRRTGDVDASVANTPARGYEVRVTNSLQLVSNVPTGPLAIATLLPGATAVYPGGTARFRLAAQDGAYNGIRLRAGEVAWSVDPALGTIDASGTFVAAPVPMGGTGTVVASARGASASAPVQVLPDLAAPVVEPPAVAPTRVAIGRSVPLRVAWPAASDAESGLARYELERSADGGAWVPVPLPSPGSTAATVALARYATHAFRLRAVDRAGNAGEWREAPPVRLAVLQERAGAIAFAGAWRRTADRAADGGAVVTSRSRGARATITVTGSGVAIVGTLGPRFGRVRIVVDGEAPVIVDLRAPSTRHRTVVWARSWATPGEHTVTLTVLRAAERQRVDLDAVVILGVPGA